MRDGSVIPFAVQVVSSVDDGRAYCFSKQEWLVKLDFNVDGISISVYTLLACNCAW